MPEKTIGSLLNVRSRFLRSAHLERDFNDPEVFAGYVPTDFTRSCLERMQDGLKPESGQRAWRLTGDYGSGKSSFGLLLAHWLSGRYSRFPTQLRRFVDSRRSGIERPRLIPILVTCSKQPLGLSILQSMHRALVDLYGRNARVHPLEEIRDLLSTRSEPSDERVFDLISDTQARVIADSKGKGLLLIVDELGKFLEFAAQHPDRQDVFLLQRLAEAAARSGKEPLYVVCMLHQGFSAYAHDLSQVAQREWEKVAGRFEEIVFNHPVEQLAELIGSALDVRSNKIPRHQSSALNRAMQKSIEIGWFGSASKRKLMDSALRIYPLHPTVLPVLIRAFRRFGQNERSLFSFLLSNEPFGLQAFAQNSMPTSQLYRLHNLYDYIRTNLGYRLATLSYRSHWGLIESVIESFSTEDEGDINILKTVGVLNLLNEGDLVATEDAVVCSLLDDNPEGAKKRLHAAIDHLRRVKRVLYNRGRTRGLCLWPHTSVDVEKASEDAHRAVDTPRRVASIIKDYLEQRPVVARRHYIQTGNLRFYKVHYCAVQELPELIENPPADTDGIILIPLCETQMERADALAVARQEKMMALRTWLIGIPEPLSRLASLVQEVQRWEWVSSNIGELNADKYAREEVSRQIESARNQLEYRIHSLVGFKQLTGEMRLQWYHRSQELNIQDGRSLLETLSDILDKAYNEAPRIHNELVNRHSLSSASAAARMRLIERMFTHSSEAFLGMNPDKKPPEMSVYLSVLKNTGLHRERAGKWRIGEPYDDKCNILPVLRHMEEIVKREPDKRVNVAAMIDEIQKPPFGVRNGVIPILITAFAIRHEKDIAFYKDGTFLREMAGEEMLVLTKAPEKFDLQYCKIEGIRANVFDRLSVLLEVKPVDNRKAELLDVVKPLCTFVAQLPQYVLNTKKLSVTALAVRDAILNAREPIKLLFTELPRACGFDPFMNNSGDSKAVQAFAKTLKTSLDELRAAYPDLLERLRKQMRTAFPHHGSFQEFRIALAGRAEQVSLFVTEAKLKPFSLRLIDDNLPESEWLESVGSCLALKPPAKWHDMDEATFGGELAELAARFHRVESVVFGHGKRSKTGMGIRLAITHATGVEHEQVIHYSAEEEDRLHELQKEFEALLDKDRRLALAAASRAIWTNLDKAGKR